MLQHLKSLIKVDKLKDLIGQSNNVLTRKFFILAQVISFVFLYWLISLSTPIATGIGFLLIIMLTLLSERRAVQLHIPKIFTYIGWIPILITPLVSYPFIKSNIDIVQSYIDKGVSPGSGAISKFIPIESISTYLFPPIDEQQLSLVAYGIIGTAILGAITYFGTLLMKEDFFAEKRTWKRKLLLIAPISFLLCSGLLSYFTVQTSVVATAGFERVGKTFIDQDDSFATDDIKDKIIPTVSFLSQDSYDSNQTMEDSVQNQIEVFYKIADSKGLCATQLLNYKNDNPKATYPNHKYGLFVGPICAANQTNGEHLLAMPISSIETQPVSLYLIKAVVNGKETAVDKTVEIKPQMNAIFFNTDENISVGDNIQLYIGSNKDTVETVVYSTVA